MNEPELVLADELAENLDYAFSDQYGYLTSCPTNTGSGLLEDQAFRALGILQNAAKTASGAFGCRCRDVMRAIVIRDIVGGNRA